MPRFEHDLRRIDGSIGSKGRHKWTAVRIMTMITKTIFFTLCLFGIFIVSGCNDIPFQARNCTPENFGLELSVMRRSDHKIIKNAQVYIESIPDGRCFTDPNDPQNIRRATLSTGETGVLVLENFLIFQDYWDNITVTAANCNSVSQSHIIFAGRQYFFLDCYTPNEAIQMVTKYQLLSDLNNDQNASRELCIAAFLQQVYREATGKNAAFNYSTWTLYCSVSVFP